MRTGWKFCSKKARAVAEILRPQGQGLAADVPEGLRDLSVILGARHLVRSPAAGLIGGESGEMIIRRPARELAPFDRLELAACELQRFPFQGLLFQGLLFQRRLFQGLLFQGLLFQRRLSRRLLFQPLLGRRDAGRETQDRAAYDRSGEACKACDHTTPGTLCKPPISLHASTSVTDANGSDARANAGAGAAGRRGRGGAAVSRSLLV